MNRGQRTVASLLAVVAVLLGVNVFIREPQHAVAAAGEAGSSPEPVLVNGAVSELFSPNQVLKVFRFWSDGTIDVTAFATGQFCDTAQNCGPTLVMGPLCARADVNRDGEVGITDLPALLGEWGPCR